MTRARQIAFSMGIVIISCASTFAQFVTNPVEKILTDESIPNTEKSNRLAAMGEEGVPKLLEYLKENTGSWNFIVPALGEIGDPSATDHLLGLLDVEPNQSRTVIRALGGLKDPKAVEPLLKLLDGASRGEAISALAAIGDPRAETPILGLMRSSDESVAFRIRCALALLAFTSEELRLEASDLLLQDKHLHDLHEKQKPVSHPYWRFPHETWWRALRVIGTEEAQRILVRWLDKTLMDYDHGDLMEIMSGISNPSNEMIESLYRYSGKNFSAGAYYSTLALETLTGYGPIVDKDRLSGEIRRWSGKVAANSDTSPSTRKIILRLTRIEAEVDSWK